MRDSEKSALTAGRRMPVGFTTQSAGRFRAYARSIAIACTVASAGACTQTVEPASRDVSVAPTKIRYNKGDTVQVVVSNQSDHEVGFSVCRSELQRLIDGVWTGILLSNPTEINCGDALATLAPRQSSSAFIVLLRESTLALPQSLSAGTYRVVIPVLNQGRPRIALSLEHRQSATFEVQ